MDLGYPLGLGYLRVEREEVASGHGGRAGREGAEAWEPRALGFYPFNCLLLEFQQLHLPSYLREGPDLTHKSS
jgi:hypothetical protein